MKFKKVLNYSVQKTFETNDISNKVLKKYFTFDECGDGCFEEFILKQMTYRTDEWIKFEEEVLNEVKRVDKARKGIDFKWDVI